MGTSAKDAGATAEANAKAAEELKRMRLKGAKKLLKELKPDELDDILIETTKELAEKDVSQQEQVGWKHIKEYEDEIKEAISIWGRVGGLSTGLPTLDGVVGGLRPGQTYLIAGESNNGKSALAAQMAVNISKEHKVGYISLEMMPGDNGARINHMNGGSPHDIRLDGMDIYFQSTPAITYKHLQPLFEQAKEQGIEVIFLDYLQFLGRSLTIDEVGKMSQVIKNLTMEYQLPLVVIVSLRKSNGGRKWSDITLEDLMGTSAIAYDSDNVILVSRMDMENEFDDHHMYVKVLKLRNMEKTKDNEFLWFTWNKTRISEESVPLHIVRARDIPVGDISEEGKLSTVVNETT